jgi:hypothetical protein
MGRMLMVLTTISKQRGVFGTTFIVLIITFTQALVRVSALFLVSPRGVVIQYEVKRTQLVFSIGRAYLCRRGRKGALVMP